MFRLGWQVFRARLPELVSDRDRRRLVVVASIVAPVVFVGLVVVVVLTDDVSVASVAASAAYAAAAGAFSMLFCRLGPKGWSIPAVPSIGWRTQDAVARYYRRSAQPVAPEHRDAVLAGMDDARDRIVRTTFQSSFLLASWLLAVVAAVLVAVSGSSVHGPVFLWAPLWPLLAGSSGGVGIWTLGRQEQLRAEASALPPVPPAPPKRGRPGGPSGSKLALPGE